MNGGGVMVAVVSGGEGGWHKVMAQRSLVSVAAKSLKQLDIKHCGDVCSVHQHTQDTNPSSMHFVELIRCFFEL